MNITFRGKWEGSFASIECKHGFIQAMLIFYKYDNAFNISGRADSLVIEVKPSYVSDEDTDFLAERGFFAMEDYFQSDERWTCC